MNRIGMRGSVAGAVVAVVATAYFAGGVHWPRDGAAQTATPGGGAVQSNIVNVSGEGRVSGRPDTVALDMGVESHGADVSKALGNADAAMAKVVTALKGQGVAEVDLKTSGLNLRPNYRYDRKNEGAPPTLIDYIASESLTVKLRDLDKAGDVISAAVSAGGNDARLNGVSLALEANAKLVTQARDAAYADAKAKAEQYAKLAGRQLGTVVSVTEQTYGSPPVPASYAASAAPAMMGDSRSVPIERGSQEVSVNVQVVWAFT
ncbi:MAG: SIMPL domain-containing protein [Mycobacteriales bacterium]